MGRKPIHKKAMTPAERQRRRRVRLKRQQAALGAKAERQQRQIRRAKLGRDYIPTPPGITYWRQVEHAGKMFWQPITQPGAAVNTLSQLSDAEITDLMTLLQREVQRRVARRNGL